MRIFLSTACSLAMVCALGLGACGVPDGELDAGSGQDAASQDAYSGPECPAGANQSGTPCGSYTEYGTCDGDLIIYCANNELRCDDCAPQHCALWDSSWGYDCLSSSGQVCSADFPTVTTSPGCDPMLGLSCVSGTCQ